MRNPQAIVLSSLMLLQRAFASDTVPDFSKLPRTAFFEEEIRWHTNAVRHYTNHTTTNLLLISAYRADNFSFQTEVLPNGRVSMYISSMTGSQGGAPKQLSEADIKKLREVLKKLPRENASPPLKHLEFVSFSDGTNWVSRFYDRRVRSKALQKVYDIVGEREDLKPKS